jgi:antitoxin component of RelBE/YafQ-DinJ toxin-antitoxin module
MKKKLRKFVNGGVSEGENPNIDEDVRSRAMKFVENASEESRDIGAPVTRSASKSTSKVAETVAPPTKPAVDMEAEKTRIAEIGKKQALERVEPENYIPGAGLVKGMLKKVVDMSAKRATKEAAIKNAARKSEEGLNPSEALDLLKPIRTRTIKGKEMPIRQNTPKFKEDNSPMSVKDVRNKSGKKVPVKRDNEDMGDGGSGAFKRGGKVSSASRRADGCAIRGKTRA